MSQAPLISALELGKTFGTDPLFSDITLAVDQNEKIALIGPNGSGKSTLLKILSGLEFPDQGEVRPRNGLRTAYVAQEDIFDDKLKVSEVLEEALSEIGFSPHEVEGKIEVICGRAGFSDKHAVTGTLSGGWKKRLAILRGLITEPDLLMLDEPTNHLDIDGIIWLEKILSAVNCAILFVSHDRYFIESLAKRVIEINRRYPKGFFSCVGGYTDFLESREDFLTGLQQTKESLANKVRREVEWLRQGAKARTTKSKYRIERAGKLQDKLKSYNLDEGKVSLEFAASNRKSKDLIKIEEVSKELGGKSLFKDVSFILSPGIRLGVIGPNGSGKTTFLNLLLGRIAPDKGKVTIAKNLNFAFFDQKRTQLDRTLTLKESLCPEGDAVVFNGRQIHVAGWAERFLFPKDKLSLPVSSLSGGEQARVLLAKLMLEKTDVLFFDEPTNDLDIRTLEILEESFSEYPGAIVLITHDRYLLDSCSTHVLGLGKTQGEIFGSYSQWESLLQSKATKVKLSPAERKELDNIEKEILKAEKVVEKMQTELISEEIASDAGKLNEHCKKLTIQQKKVEDLYNRWEELEAIKKEIRSQNQT